MNVLVLEGLSQGGIGVLRGEGFSVDEREQGMSGRELVEAIAPYHALIVRTRTIITAELLDAAVNLRVIGRPGIGFDNVDVAAATARGIVVMISPEGNVISAAELTVALLLAVARHVPRADAAMKAGVWERKSFGGVELYGKRLGIVGLGRIGSAVAVRAQAFGMDVVACDPYKLAASAEELRVPLVALDELLRTCDFLSVHTPLTDETRNLVDVAALARTRPGVRVVNAARGGIVDEAALLAALDSGHVAGAGIDVHTQEPPSDWGLAHHPRVVALPHLGAATAEAYERSSLDVARQVRNFMTHGVIRHAVNHPGVIPRAGVG